MTPARLFAEDVVAREWPPMSTFEESLGALTPEQQIAHDVAEERGDRWVPALTGLRVGAAVVYRWEWGPWPVHGLGRVIEMPSGDYPVCVLGPECHPAEEDTRNRRGEQFLRRSEVRVLP